MIFDKFENLDLYSNTHPRFKKAFNWLKSTDLNNLKPGEKIYFDEKNIFGWLVSFETAPAHTMLFEGHNKYIDIHLMLEGTETMDVGFPLGDEPILEPYDENKDKYKLNMQESAKLIVNAGEFAIFFPQDLHRTNANPAPNLSSNVRKIIVKVLF